MRELYLSEDHLQHDTSNISQSSICIPLHMHTQKSKVRGLHIDRTEVETSLKQLDVLVS